jgi:hypothetical protein
MSCSPTTLVEFVDEWILDHACCYKEGSGNTVHKNQCSICFFIIHPSLRSGTLRYVFFFKYSLRETFILSMTMVATVLLLKFILTTRLWHDEKLPLTYLIFDRQYIILSVEVDDLDIWSMWRLYGHSLKPVQPSFGLLFWYAINCILFCRIIFHNSFFFFYL